MYAIRRLGEPEDVLGIVVLRDWDAETIPLTSLCHDRKALSLAEAFGRCWAAPVGENVAGHLRRLARCP